MLANTVGVAIYSWDGGGSSNALPFSVGEKFTILSSRNGWSTASRVEKPEVVGMVPTGMLVEARRAGGNTAKEILQVVRIWGEIYKQLYVMRDMSLLARLEKAVEDLVNWRCQLRSGTLTQEEEAEVRQKAAEKMDWGNKVLGLEKIARDELGKRMEEEGCIGLYHAYRKGTDSSRQGTMGRKKEDRRMALTNHHLVVGVEGIGEGLGCAEDVVLCCQLYSDRRPGYVSERWCVPELKSGPKAVFLDLGSLDQCLDLHLVVQVYRLGKILVQDSGKPQQPLSRRSFAGRSPAGHESPQHKRPVSGGVVSVSHLFHSERRSNLPDNDTLEARLAACEEKDFHHLHEVILKKNSSKYYNPSFGPTSITFNVSVYNGDQAHVKQTFPLVFKDSTEVRRLGFPSIIMPGDVRNDLYLTLERGQFERGGKAAMSTARNIEVSISVFDKAGVCVEGSVIPAAGGGPVCPALYYHNNAPCWGETFRLEVPIDKFRASGCHLRLEYRHCSVKDKQEKKFFGFSWLELMRHDDTVVLDGVHELPIYKCDDREKLKPSVYLPSSEDDVCDSFSRSSKEAVTVHTLLCSTKLTQNLDLMTLLKWRATPDKIPEILERTIKIGGEEVVKFLQDVLDALFAMFSTEDGNSTKHSGLVFHVLVHILASLQDPKFEHFKPVIEAYINDHFAAALVYKGLLSCVRHCADMVPNTERQDPIRKCFQSLHYIFRLTVASRQLFARATGGQNEDSFKVDVHLLFNSFNKMLSCQFESVLPTQVVFLQNMSAIYPSLIQVLPIIDIAKLVTLTLDSLSQRSERSPIIQRAALTAAQAALNSPLWSDPASRGLLLPVCLYHVTHHLTHRRELTLATDILLEVIQLLENDKKRDDYTPWWREVNTLATACLGPVGVAVIAEQEVENQGLEQTALTTAFLGMLELITPEHHISMWRHDSGDLGRLFVVLSEVVSRSNYPQEWLSLRLAAAKTVSSATRAAGDCLPILTFDKQLWMAYFRLAVSFVTSPLLQLETMAKQNRMCLEIKSVGDLRIPMAQHMVEMWERCQERVHLLPSLVGPLLEVTLLPSRDIRQTILPLFILMVEEEQKSRGNFKQVETELIDKLDILISENKGDDEYRQLFNNMMLDLVQQLDPLYRDSGTEFVSSVSRLLERLLDYRDVLQGDENRDKRMSCTVNLLKFYRDDINRREMFIRYIYKLHDLHIVTNNHAEAAFTLQLHANTLEWTTRVLHADLEFPMQKEWHRKELLYLKIIDLFDRAHLWEYALPLCKELAQFYESQEYDFVKLSGMLRRQAGFYDRIITELRPEPEYFRVGFYGLGFPLFVRNKVFIYRGLAYERIAEFTQRLSKGFKEATILMKNTPPEDSILQEDDQFIQICSVKPISNDDSIYEGPNIPEKIKSFYSVNNVSKFVYDRPIQRGPTDQNNEFKSLWLERTTLESSSQFPGILCWFEIVNNETCLVPPVQFACETIKDKNIKLRKLIDEYSLDGEKNISPFTMTLQGIIDAAVNGGIDKYREAFFCPEFWAENPDQLQVVEFLADLVNKQAKLLEEALVLHGDLAPEPVQPLHSRLLQLFGGMKDGMQKHALMESPQLRRTSSIVNTPLPPVPDQFLKTNGSSKNNHRNGIYGKFTIEDEAEIDDIYCKPMDLTYDSGMSCSSPGSVKLIPSFSIAQLAEHTKPASGYIWLGSKNEGEPISNHRPPPLRPIQITVDPEQATYANTGIQRDSGIVSEDSNEELAPPIPPRSTGRTVVQDDTKGNSSPGRTPPILICQSSGLSPSLPPSLPRRLSKTSQKPGTNSANTSMTGSISGDISISKPGSISGDLSISKTSSISGDISESPPAITPRSRPTSPSSVDNCEFSAFQPSQQPPALNKRINQVARRPPPLPPKLMSPVSHNVPKIQSSEISNSME